MPTPPSCRPACAWSYGRRQAGLGDGLQSFYRRGCLASSPDAKLWVPRTGLVNDP